MKQPVNLYQHRFYIGDREKPDAWLDFELRGEDEMVLVHTAVQRRLQGQGMGAELVRAAVDHARTNGLTIQAKCPYAKHILDSTPAYGDVYTPG